MKLFKSFIVFFGLLSTVLTSCIKDDSVILDGSFVEWDAATYNANAAGQLYPVLTRTPRYGEPQNNADPLITRSVGSVKLRINLVGAHRPNSTELTFQAVQTGTTAVAGTHYSTTGKVTIPANSSFGEAEIQILNPGASTGTRDLVLELVGNGDVKPSENEKRIALRISQL